MNPYLVLSTDLMRISNWIFRGQDKLADQFLGKITGDQLSDYPQYFSTINQIKNRKLGREKSAEQALTLSRILFYKGQNGDNTL